jgi:hypothetical protein
VDNDAIALRPRLSLAIATIASVAAAELGTFFCFNARLAITGLLTSIFVVVPLARLATAWMGARGAFLVGVTSLGCIPTALIIGGWEARGFTSSPTSDFEDFSLFVLLVGGLAAAALFAIRRTRGELPKTLCSTTRRLFFGALVVAVVLVARALLRALQGSSGAPLAVIVAGALGVALAVAFAVAARRARAEQERLASGVSGSHRGDGWLDFDDGAPPVHRPDLAGRRDGPVVVLGRTAMPSQAYRGTPSSDASLTVTFGTPDSIRDAGATRAASHHAVGMAALAFPVLPLVALLSS